MNSIIIAISGVIISLLIPAKSLIAQCSYQDFLSENDVVIKAEKGIYLWNEYLRSDLDSLKIMSIELLLDAANKKNKFAKAVGNGSLGSYLIRGGNVRLGVNHLNQARRYYELTDNPTLLSECLNELGHGYMLMGDHQTAVSSYLQSLQYGKNATDETDAFNAKLGLGKAYCALGDTALGVINISQYKNESLKYNKYEAAADSYAILGQIEMDRNNVGLSREYYEKSMFYSNKCKSKIHLSHAFNNKAILHFNLGELDSTLYFFNKALKIRKELNNKKGIAESYFNIGSYYAEIKDFNRAIEFFKLSANVGKANKFNIDEKDAWLELNYIYQELKNDIGIHEATARLAQLENKIAKEIDLNKEIIAQTDSIVAATQMEGDKTSKKNNNFNFLIVILLASLVLVFFIYLNQRTNRN